MATHSVNIKRCNSQVSLSCQHCNGSKNLKYRCMDCKTPICDNCMPIHSPYHKVMDFEEIIRCNIGFSRTEKETKRMQRKLHEGKTNVSFCTTCNDLVCRHCQNIPHLDHGFIDINQFLEEKNHDTHVKIKIFEGSGDSGSDDEFNETDSDFVMVDSSEYATGFSFSTDSSCQDLFLSYFQVHDEIISYLSAIKIIEPLSENNAYLSEVDGNSICEVQINRTNCLGRKRKQSNCREIDKIEGFSPIGLTLNSNGDIFFIRSFGYSVKSVKINQFGKKQISDVCTFNPLEPTCIQCAKDEQKLWIGLKDHSSNFELSENSKRQVVLINQTGEVCKKYEYSKAGKRLFTLPWKIRIGQNKCICIIDRTSDIEGRIISLHDGHLMWIYKGSHNFNKRPFCPIDMAVTNSGNNIILDTANIVFHALDGQGKFIFQQSLSDIGVVEHPLCMNIDESQHLWVGCRSNPDSKQKRSKIYEIKISGL